MKRILILAASAAALTLAGFASNGSHAADCNVTINADVSINGDAQSHTICLPGETPALPAPPAAP